MPLYDQVETDYPIPRTQYTKLYLTSNHTLEHSPSKTEAVHSFDSTKKAVGTHFDYIFPERTKLAGFSKIKLYMSCKEHNDFDVYIQLRKLSVDGELMEQSNVPFHELPPEVKTAKDV